MLAMAAFVAVTIKGNLNLTLPGVIAIAAGLLILIFPKVLNYIVALYLILVGVIQVFHLRIGG